VSSDSRAVARTVPALQTMEGDGMDVMRPFPAGTLSYIDPFLLLDRLGPVHFAPGAAKGVPPHPHRGFEVVTYLLSGRMTHRDSFGGSGTLGPGDVQWMRAGSGVVHSEMPDDEFRRTGGTLHAVQLWVNLPRADKMLPPEYRDIPARSVPHVDNKAAHVTVIAGEAFGARATLATRIPIMYLHVTIKPRQSIAVPVAAGDTALAYSLEGSGYAGTDRRAFAPNQLIVFEADGQVIDLAAEDGPAELVVLAARPLGEPVARYGPFVMNTPHEVSEAIDDYRSGKMGSL
jgi:redox-sensitive bicupin YhaK (pirin superfamily)